MKDKQSKRKKKKREQKATTVIFVFVVVLVVGLNVWVCVRVSVLCSDVLRLRRVLSGNALEQRRCRKDLSRIQGDRAPPQNGPRVLLLDDEASGLVEV